MKTTTVRFQECGGAGRVWVSRHRTQDSQQALRRAINRNWGSRHSLWRDYGLSQDGLLYGQITYPAQGGYTTVTGRVRVDIETPEVG